MGFNRATFDDGDNVDGVDERLDEGLDDDIDEGILVSASDGRSEVAGVDDGENVSRVITITSASDSTSETSSGRLTLTSSPIILDTAMIFS